VKLFLTKLHLLLHLLLVDLLAVVPLVYLQVVVRLGVVLQVEVYRLWVAVAFHQWVVPHQAWVDPQVVVLQVVLSLNLSSRCPKLTCGLSLINYLVEKTTSTVLVTNRKSNCYFLILLL
jgi:hypothetical protein